MSLIIHSPKAAVSDKMKIDAHCHLTDARYESVKTVVFEAQADGVNIMVDSGWNAKNSLLAKDNAQIFDGVYFTAGIHPSEANTFTAQDIEIIKSLLIHPKCLAVGEIGLDYHYDGVIKENQFKLFEAQLELAKQFELPVVVHSRDASSDVLNILRSYRDCLKHGFLMHCYSESLEQAKNYLDLGAYFSFGGVLTFKNSKKDEILKSIPKDRLLMETDSPYLTPAPFRGQINYPKYVCHVYKKAASVLEMDEQAFILLVKENFSRLFKKA